MRAEIILSKKSYFEVWLQFPHSILDRFIRYFINRMRRIYTVPLRYSMVADSGLYRNFCVFFKGSTAYTDNILIKKEIIEAKKKLIFVLL